MKKPSVLLAEMLSYIVYYSPAKLRYAWAWCLAVLWFDVLRVRRSLILQNLERAFPLWDAKKRIQVGRRSVFQLGLSFFEFLLVPRLNKEWIGDNVEFEGFEQLEKAREDGRGVLLLSMHLGSVDLGATVVAMEKLPIHLISKKFRSQWANDFWFFVRSQMGVQFIDPHGTKSSFDILKALKKNHGVVFVLDQFMGPPYGIPTRFFGQATGTAYGLALFATKTKSPIFPIYTLTTPEGKTKVVVEKEIPFVTKGSRDDTIHFMTQRFNDKIEEVIRNHPDQWMWVHNRWKPYRRRQHTKELFFERQVN